MPGQGVAMNLTLDYLKSNRKWLVPNLMVWGNAEAIQPQLLLTEETDDSKRIVFTDNIIGGKNQTVDFSDLIDSRGNHLPEEIANPIIVIIPRDTNHCYLVGRPSCSGFKIARSESSTGSLQHGLVDLLVMEVDLP
jgi:hypothetical protein